MSDRAIIFRTLIRWVVIAFVVLALYVALYIWARAEDVVGWTKQAGVFEDRHLTGLCATVFAPARVGERTWRRWRNRQWLADNGARPRVTTTSTGLQYEILAASTGTPSRRPEKQDHVLVRYEGQFIDGSRFDAQSSDPVRFPVAGVIAGFSEALMLMHAGDRYRIAMPPQLGYGESGIHNKIGPEAILIFDIELVGIAE